MHRLAADTPAALAEVIAALEATGPLPARTVLVRSERHAHALRRALERAGHGRVLAGTSFVGPVTAAAEVLRSAGVPFSAGEEALRPARLVALFREGLALEHFDLALLRTTRGWDDAFARAIGDLEGAALRPADLPVDPAASRDLAAIWSRLDLEAGRSLTAARLLAEAAAVLAADPRAWPLDGPALAAVTGHEDGALARFLRAVPRLELAMAPARPPGTRHLARVEALHGREAREAAAAPGAPSSGTERGLLAGWLFADSPTLADPSRPRSLGPDGTVQLEEHAGVEAEIAAAAEWVARQVLEAKLPLEEIAVLVPSEDPLVQLLAERISRLPCPGGAFPVHVAGGVPMVATSGGARVLAVLRALEANLGAEALAEVLPALVLEGPDVVLGVRDEAAPPQFPPSPKRHLSHGEAMALAFGLGTAGGNAAHPEGALAWSARAAAREAELARALERGRRGEDSSAREVRRMERAHEALRAVRPALDALVDVARTAVSGAPLASLWDALRAFLGRWLLLPGEGASIPARLDEALAPLCAGAPGRILAGPEALEAVTGRLLALRAARGRFGEPAVYVGTVAGAAGLDFGAVRIAGLAEGTLPRPAREDPVLPEALRERLERAAEAGGGLRVVSRAEDRALADQHALAAAVAGARRSVALSAPATDLARTEREPASSFVDAAAALGRPHAATGAPASAVPDGRALRRDAFRPAREAAARFRAASPVSEASWLDRVARHAPELPPGWAEDPLLGLDRLSTLARPGGPAGPAGGVLGAGDPFPELPGLTPERPISASQLQQLLECPRMFLMRRVLGWDEPASAPPVRELDPASFGSLLHGVLEAFYRAHGADLVAGKGSLAGFLARAGEAAHHLFEELLCEYPLVGEGVRRKERERLLEGVRAFVRYDWGARAGRRYLGVELPFGVPDPLALPAGGGILHVRGYLDRVDVEGDATLVRDVKSGRPHPRRRTDLADETGPVPQVDVQLGLYALAARELAPRWGTPEKVVAAYAYTSGRGEVQERSFREDPAALEDAARGWLATAARLLRARAFPPAEDERACLFCPFRPLCGGER